MSYLYATAVELRKNQREEFDGVMYDINVHLVGSDIPLTLEEIFGTPSKERDGDDGFMPTIGTGLWAFKDKHPDKYLGQFYILKTDVDSIKQRLSYLISDINNAILLAKHERKFMQNLCRFLLKCKDTVEFHFCFIPIPPESDIVDIPTQEQIGEYGNRIKKVA